MTKREKEQREREGGGGGGERESFTNQAACSIPKIGRKGVGLIVYTVQCTANMTRIKGQDQTYVHVLSD